MIEMEEQYKKGDDRMNELLKEVIRRFS